MEEESKEAAPAAAEEESDEEDPLDAFMAGIEVRLVLVVNLAFSFSRDNLYDRHSANL